jgi:GH15 family glucan-1,4-alpha-glucosidase
VVNEAVYKPIADYGVVGDLQTVALIGRDGAIDWLCYPYIDSPSVFGALLDAHKGGRFLVQPVEPFDSVAYYMDQTNILITRFRTRNGLARLIDFMPVTFMDRCTFQEESVSQALYRCLEVESGVITMTCLFEPRFDYGRAKTRLSSTQGGVLASSAEWSMALSCTHELHIESDQATAHWSLHSGDTVWFRLGSTESGLCRHEDTLPETPSRSWRLLDQTADFWRSWLNKSETGRRHAFSRYQPMIERSALVLKLLFYGPKGTMAAAATTSLPEGVGGERNWDYRFTWLRDAAFTLKALFNLGHLSETEGYLRWIESVLSEHGAENLQIMYGLRGETDLTEQELNHLDGYKGSRPVRVGNGAAKQIQLDVFGEIMDAALLLADYVGKIDVSLWPVLRDICDQVLDLWTKKDNGIWEVRGGPYHFVYSKVMCWVALDRGIQIAKRYGFQARLSTWQETMQRIKDDVLEHGYSQARQAFVQHYETEELDASNLLIPLLGFLPPDDPRVVSTVDLTTHELSQNGFVYRYTAHDGLEGQEGSFLVCTFWLIDCLVAMGRLEEAETWLRNVEKAANHLGLFAEEYDVHWQEALGNFPQAFTHIGYINSVLNLIQAKESQRAEKSRPVPDKKMDRIRKKLLSSEIILNLGSPKSHVANKDLAEELKISMNQMRGAFFDSHHGRVSYEQMKGSALYSRYMDLSLNLQHFQPEILTTEAAKKAFWINLYNVIVIHGVIELNIIDSVQEVRNFFTRIKYNIGGHHFTPDDIEHGILRANRRAPRGIRRPFSKNDPRQQLTVQSLDARIHFALVCASSSCPPIEIYTAENMEHELKIAGRTFLNAGGVEIDRTHRVVKVSKIFLWYANDFGPNLVSRLRFIAPYLYDQEDRDFLAKEADTCHVEYLDYDWRLNR